MSKIQYSSFLLLMSLVALAVVSISIEDSLIFKGLVLFLFLVMQSIILFSKK